MLDAAGRYPEAYGAYAACNEILRELHRRFGEGTTMLSYIESIIAAMGRIDPAQWRKSPGTPNPGGASAHVFLIGFPRSGTTLLEVALDGHPRVASLEEHELLKAGVLAYMREPVDFTRLVHADENELDPLRERYWAEVREAGLDVTGKVFVDKHPLHSLKLPLIARLFPDAKILFAHRDPRDVVLSCFRRRFSMNPAMYQLLRLESAAALLRCDDETGRTLAAPACSGLARGALRGSGGEFRERAAQGVRGDRRGLEGKPGGFCRACTGARARHAQHRATGAWTGSVGRRPLAALPRFDGTGPAHA